MNKDEKLNELKGVKNKNLFTAISHAIDGVICAFRSERNLRIDYIIGLFVLLASLFFDFTNTEFACLCLTIGFVIFSEMMNSIVEYVVDLITDKYDKRAKAAKDIAAGGVLVSSCIAVIVAYFLFVDKISAATNGVVSTILSSKLYVLFTILFAAILLIVILKGFFNKAQKYSESFPSLRVVIAFAMTTFVFIITKSLMVGIISLILSLIIAQIKIENTKTRPIYMIFSALIGILLVLIIYQITLIKPYIGLFIN